MTQAYIHTYVRTYIHTYVHTFFAMTETDNYSKERKENKIRSINYR